MIEQIVRDYLISKLPVGVYLEIPDKPDAEYVTLEKTGGGESNHIKRATLAIQSRADSMYGAAALNEEVKEAMLSIIDLDSIASVSLNSDYNFTDTTTKKYRYQAVFDLVFY